MKHLYCYFAPPIGYMIYRCVMLGEQNHTLTVLIWFLLECPLETDYFIHKLLAVRQM